MNAKSQHYSRDIPYFIYYFNLLFIISSIVLTIELIQILFRQILIGKLA